jgi:hypothetical protein
LQTNELETGFVLEGVTLFFGEAEIHRIFVDIKQRIQNIKWYPHRYVQILCCVSDKIYLN